MKTIQPQSSRSSGILLSLCVVVAFAAECLAAPTSSDSLATVGGDSLSRAAYELGEREYEFDLWARPSGSSLSMAGRRPATLADALREHSSMQLRESGDPGARALLSLSPVDSRGPEYFVDGVPTRSPADSEPSIYDQSQISLSALRNSDPMWDLGGPFALHGELDAALDGRTRLRSHFTASGNETYYRGLSWSTPRAARTVRFDFEEWKTEEGYASFVSQASRPSGFGRAKQRRFEFTGQSRSSVGQLSLRFGRGRRYHDGYLLGTNPLGGAVERWTGTIAAGIDRGDSTSHTRLRLFHLDWQDVDEAHLDQTRDAARLGIRAQRTVVGGGWSWMLQAERRAANFVDAAGGTSRPDPVYVARAAVGHDAGAAWRSSVRVELAANDASSQRVDVGGAMLLRRSTGGLDWRAGVERRVHMPSLMELAGTWQADFGDGLQRILQGASGLDMERQDRAHVGLGGDIRGLEWSLLAEYWRLRRGIGWEIQSDSQAAYAGGLELDAPLSQLRLRRSFGKIRRGLLTEVQASHLLDAPEIDGSRGSGWARSWMGASVTAWTRLFNDLNRLSLRYSFSLTGKRPDDVTTPLLANPSLTALPRESRHDLRLTLRIRDAELYLLWENISDATIQEISSTRLRGRQRVWGLFWNFYN